MNKRIAGFSLSECVIAYVEKYPSGVRDTAEGIMRAMEHLRPLGVGDAWPRTPKGFADLLRRAAPALRQLGIEVHSLPKTGGVIRWVIEKKLPRACPERPACPAEQDIKTCRTSNPQVSSEEEPGVWI